MEKDDKGSMMIRMGVSGWMFLLVPAYPGCPGSKAVKRSLLLFCCYVISLQRLTLETSDFVHGSAMWSLSLVMSECFLSRRGQGHVSNFYIVDLENFATASRRYTGDIHNSTVVGLFMTPETWEPTRSHHGWVHIVYHALPPTKSPTSYHRFGQDLSCTVYCCMAIGKISVDTTHRAVPRR